LSLALAALVFGVALAVLFKAGQWFVTGAVGLSVRLSLPKILIGIVVAGFSTTLPELLVSVQAALRGEVEMALGNAVGSVIADDALALALAALIAPIVLHQKATFRVAALFLIAIDFGAYALAYDGVLSRAEGAIMVGVLVVYIVFALISAQRGRALLPSEDVEVEVTSWTKILLYFLGGLAGVLVASELIIDSSITIAEAFRVPKFIISLTLVALGTSLPEIATVVAASRKDEGEMAVGNIIGADILNVLWIAGMSALANPIHTSRAVINFSFPAMVVVVLVTLTFLRTKWRLERWEGGVLLALYGVYLVLAWLLGVNAQL